MQNVDKLVNPLIFHPYEEQYDSTELVRESMSVLPAWMQPMLTWLTAKPIHLKAKVERSAWSHLCSTLCMLIAGVSITYLSFNSNWYYLLPLSLVLTVSGMRKLQVVIYHHCSHNSVLKTKTANSILGETISIILAIKNFKNYQKDHMVHHNAHGLLTSRDETVQDLEKVGLIPGQAKSNLYLRLYLSFVSPLIHLRLIWGRFKATFLSNNYQHNLLAICFWSLLCFTVNILHAWAFFLVAWVFPLTILYHISRTLRLLVEHTWTNDISERNRDFIAATTIAVFCGEALPCVGRNNYKKIVAYTYWSIKMMTVHLFFRVFVLVGDTPCHDFHHRNPSSKEWLSYIYAREKDQQLVKERGQFLYKETWGFLAAIERNLSAMSQARGLYERS